MPSLLDLLGETWPARMAKSAWSAAKLPGDVYAGRTDPLSDEGIGRAADLGGMVMGGTFAGAPAGAMGAGAVKPIRAYHGSPHDFDRFDLSKIGTGEGAQAYGHGLYFAENPAVAAEYKKNLSPSALYIQNYGGKEAAIAHLRGEEAKLLEGGARPEMVQQVRSIIDDLNAGRHGRMYEVNINAAPEQFLDWDKPIKSQPEILDKVRQTVMPSLRGTFDANAESGIAGANAYRNYVGGSDAGASQVLRDYAGIPGIKYLDQGSRFNQALYNDNPIAKEALKFVEAAGGNSEKAAEAFYKSNPVDRWAVPERDEIRRLIQMSGNKPTSNYVLFRDDIIDIVKKYGLAGAATMLGISQDEAKAAMDNPKDKKMSIGRQTYGDEE